MEGATSFALENLESRRLLTILVSPSNLVETTSTTNSISLSWKDNSGIEQGFQIQRLIGSTYIAVANTQNGVTKFTDSGLTPGTAYAYRVVAFAGADLSGFTYLLNATTSAVASVPPIAPSALTATAGATTPQITLNWTDSPGIEDSVSVERQTGSGAFSVIATLPAHTKTYLDTGLTSGTTYTYRVNAKNSAGTSAYSNTSSATAQNSGAPTAPSNLTAVSASSTSNTLNWTVNATNQTSTFVQRLGSDGVTWSTIQVIPGPGGATTFTDTGLTTGTTYSYRVYNVNLQGNSPFSNTATATPGAATVAAPSNLAGNPQSTTSIGLTWADNAAGVETGFSIERQSGSGSFAVVNTVAAGVTFFTDTGLTPGTAYSYRIAATSATGNSGYSNTTVATTPSANVPPPSAPMSLTAIPTSSTAISLTWTDTAAGTETGFSLERQVGTGDFAVFKTLGTGVTSFIDTGLTPSTVYGYRVAAIGAGGNSGYSNSTAVTTPAAPTTTETPFTGTAISLPGLIEAENFDNGGEGVGYHTSNATNFTSNLYRTSGISVEATGDTGGGFDVGYNRVGDYLKYTVNVATAGTYTLTVRAANPSAGGAFHVEVDGVNVSGAQTISPTATWQTYTPVSASGISLTSGQHIVKLVMDGANAAGFVGNFNSLQFATSAVSNTPAAPTSPTATANSSTAVTLNWSETSSANVTGFSVERQDGGAGAFSIQKTITDPTVTTYVDTSLAANTLYTYRIKALNSGGTNSDYSALATVTTPAAGTTETPFNGTAAAIPGQIEAENFDNGGQGVAYNTSNATNFTNNLYRTSGITVENATDTGGGFDVGFTHAGDYLKYTTTVATAGSYDLTVRAASPALGAGFHVEVDGVNVSGAMSIPVTASWQDYVNITKTGISLTAGSHVVRLVLDSNNSAGFAGNFNWLKFSASASAGTETPFGGTAAAVPGKVEAENFDLGGEGVAYHTSNTQNYTGGTYRNEGPTLESTTDTGGGFDLGYTHAGDFFKYTVNVATAGKYDLTVRASSPAAGAQVHVEIDGTTVATLGIPTTATWQDFTTLSQLGISLTAGNHVVKLVMDTNNTFGFAGNYNWFALNASSV